MSDDITSAELVHPGGEPAAELEPLPRFHELADPATSSLHERMVALNKDAFPGDPELQSFYEDTLRSALHGMNMVPGMEQIYAIGMEMYIHQWAIYKQRTRISQRIEAEIPDELREVVGPVDQLAFLDIKALDTLVKRCQGLMNTITKASSTATTELAVRRKITGICVNALRDVLKEKLAHDHALSVDILVETVDRISEAMDTGT